MEVQNNMISEYNNYNSIINELNITEDGIITCTKSGIARLCGVNESSIRRLLDNLRHKSPSRPLEPFAQCKFEGSAQLPDTLVSAIIQHYAYKGYETAQDSLSAFSGIGFRTWGKQLLGEPLESNTDSNLGNHLVTIGKAMTEIGNAVNDLYQRDQQKQKQIEQQQQQLDKLNIDKKLYHKLASLKGNYKAGNYGNDYDTVRHYPVTGLDADFIANILGYHTGLRERDKNNRYFYPFELLELFTCYNIEDIKRVANRLRIKP